MLLRRVTGSGADLVMEARRVECHLLKALDGRLFVRAGGFWLAANGDQVFLNTASAPVEKIGTRQLLISLRDGSVWVKPDGDDAFVDFTYEPALRMPTTEVRAARKRSDKR